MHERTLDQVADVVVPCLGRMLYVAPKGAKPIVVLRDYHASRLAVAKVMELTPKLEALMAEIDVEVEIGVPMMKDDHEMLRMAYCLTQWLIGDNAWIK